MIRGLGVVKTLTYSQTFNSHEHLGFLIEPGGKEQVC